jgi:hypothetical protein
LKFQIRKPLKHDVMKKVLIACLLLCGATACNGQAEKSETLQNKASQPESRPGASWKVNRHYDEKGNLIGYDSTYVWSFSPGNGGLNNTDPDSMMAAFRQYFNAGFPTLFSEGFGEPIWNDSLFSRDFGRSDYFMQRWQQHFFDVNKLMQRMDSMHNDFLRQNYPGSITERRGREYVPKKTL